MAKRTIYVLRDSVTGLYYCNRGNNFYEWNDKGDVAHVNPKSKYHTFENAVIHTTEKSVKSGQKGRATSFRRDLKLTDADVKVAQWRSLCRDLARERQHLPEFGIEIVSITISDGKA